MRQLFATICFFLLTSQSANAGCAGANLIEELSAEDYAAISAAAETDPFGAGNMWVAEKDGRTITLIGTLHNADPRIDQVMAGITPGLLQSDVVMLELNREGMAAIANAPNIEPDRFFIRSGPTLPALLGEEEWAELSDALTLRGVPGFVAAQFRPWYVSLLLMAPPCLVQDQMAGATGLDMRVLEAAEEAGLPVLSLDRVEDVLALFQEGTEEEHLDAIELALDQQADVNALASTTVEAYFAEQARLLWEFNRLTLDRNDSIPEEDKQSMLAELEEKLLIKRNLAWIDQIIETSNAHDTITVAVGALHFTGEVGLPKLLAERGFELKRAGDAFWEP